MNDFDDKAKQWDQNQMHLERTKAVARDLQERIPISKDMKALEFGAGTGLLSFFLKESFAGITLMDTSREMLNMAEAKLAAGEEGKIQTMFFDLETGMYTDGQFDIIFTQMVLHHIRDVKAILEKFHQLLVPGGYLAIADLYPEDGSFHDPGAEVHHGFDPGDLVRQMEELGFVSIDHHQCFVVRKETETGTIKEFPVFFLSARR